MKKYWTYEECKIEALKYKNRLDLKEGNKFVFAKINRNRWYELYDHMEIIGNRYKRLIYVYEFPDNTCYVGLTGNIKKRNNQHLNKENGSSVYNGRKNRL